MEVRGRRRGTQSTATAPPNPSAAPAEPRDAPTGRSPAAMAAGGSGTPRLTPARGPRRAPMERRRAARFPPPLGLRPGPWPQSSARCTRPRRRRERRRRGRAQRCAATEGAQPGGAGRAQPSGAGEEGPAARHLSRTRRGARPRLTCRRARGLGRRPRTFSIPAPRRQGRTAARPLRPLRTRPGPARGNPREGTGRAGLTGAPTNRRSARQRSPTRVPRGGAAPASGRVRRSRLCPQVRGAALSVGARGCCAVLGPVCSG